MELLSLDQREGKASSVIHQQAFQLESQEARELWRKPVDEILHAGGCTAEECFLHVTLKQGAADRSHAAAHSLDAAGSSHTALHSPQEAGGSHAAGQPPPPGARHLSHLKTSLPPSRLETQPASIRVTIRTVAVAGGPDPSRPLEAAQSKQVPPELVPNRHHPPPLADTASSGTKRASSSNLQVGRHSLNRAAGRHAEAAAASMLLHAQPANDLAAEPEVSSSQVFLTEFKDLRLPLQPEVQVNAAQLLNSHIVQFELRCSSVALFVALDGHVSGKFSDNNVLLLPWQSRTLIFMADMPLASADDFASSMHITSLAETVAAA